MSDAMRICWNAAALALLIALSAPACAAGRLADRELGPQWPNVGVPEDDGPQWPSLGNRIGKDDTGPQWPNLPPIGSDDSKYPGLPSLSAQIGLDRDLNGLAGKPAPKDNLDVTGSVSRRSRSNRSVMAEPDLEASAARWPTLQPSMEPQSRFRFEVGARYWYSGGNIRLAFTNMNPTYGSPTSTLDWRGLEAHTGEIFARLDHDPSGFFVKAVVGGGIGTRGRMDDRDYFAGQILISDTTSDVKANMIGYLTADVGWGYAPMPNAWIGAFVGYHFWREKQTGYGVLCNAVDPRVTGGCAAGSVSVSFDTAAITYEPTWHALRLGFESKVAIDNRWTVNGEIVGVPYAHLKNLDSHLLRSDLGPSPNGIDQSSAGFGVQAEVFVNFALTPNIEIGGGLRYWHLVTQHGTSLFVKSNQHFPLDRFEQDRYGVLLQAKGKF
jgi:hypothetical protein